MVWLPEDEPARSSIGRALARHARRPARATTPRGGLLIGEINGSPPAEHPLTPFLVEAGFNPSAMGFQMRRPIGARRAREPGPLHGERHA